MNKPGTRSSKVEIIKRRETVMRLLLAGASRIYIVQSVSKAYECSERIIDKDLAYCREQFKVEFQKFVEGLFPEYKAKLDFLYELAVTQNNIGEARKILMDLITLKTSVITPQSHNSNEPPDELKAIDTQKLLNLIKKA